MLRMKMLQLLFLITCSSIASSVLGLEAPLLSIERISDGVYVFEPTEEALASWRAVSNSGAVELEDGILIYDSHWSPAHFEEAQRLLRRFTPKPVRYAVVSHYHGDHTGGTWALAKQVELISHEWTRDQLINDFAALPEQLPKEIARQQQHLEGVTDPARRAQLENMLGYTRDLLALVERETPAPIPTLTFERQISLHRGREVEIYFLGRGHTAGDVVLFLPQEKVAFLGDLLFHGTLPNIRNGFSLEWINTLEAVLALGATRFVPGHGRPCGAECMEEQITYLRWLRSAVEPFVRQGQGLDAALAKIELPARYADHEMGSQLRHNVEKVFQEMAEGN